MNLRFCFGRGENFFQSRSIRNIPDFFYKFLTAKDLNVRIGDYKRKPLTGSFADKCPYPKVGVN